MIFFPQMKPENMKVWNALGLTATNGAVVMSFDILEVALDLARSQSAALKSTAANEGGE